MAKLEFLKQMAIKTDQAISPKKIQYSHFLQYQIFINFLKNYYFIFELLRAWLLNYGKLIEIKRYLQGKLNMYHRHCSKIEQRNMPNDQDHLDVLRKIDNSSKLTQRQLAAKLGFSLGKLNYCIKSLKKKGLVKITNFKKNPNKIRYLYILTPRGIAQKAKLTINFMKRKMKEYDELKKEIETLNSHHKKKK